MHHPEMRETQSGGCICAEKMEGEYGSERSRAKQREAKLHNAAGRRQRWPELLGWKRSRKGNVHFSKDGRGAVIFASGPRLRFLIEDAGQAEPYISPRSNADVREAKLAAFDAFTYQQEA